jgi:hypothetical protein
VLTRKWSATENHSSALQIGVLDPLGGESASTDTDRVPESGELSRVPAIGARQSWNWRGGASGIAVSGYFARHNYGFSRTAESWAGMMDWKLHVSHSIEFTGEVYRGQALGGLWGGGGTSTVFNGDPSNPVTTSRAVNTAGGWAQLKVKPGELLEFNGAFGVDSPFARDVRFSKFASPFLKNQTAMFNVIGHPRSDILVSLEYRHLLSDRLEVPKSSAQHVNLAIGYRF